MQFFRSSKYIALILVLGMASFAGAAIIPPGPPDFAMMMQVGGGAPYGLPATAVPFQDPESGKTKYQIDATYDQHGYHMAVHFVVDPDPTITGNVAITNLTAGPQNYLFTFTLPVAPSFNPSLLNGSVGVTATADATAGAVASFSPDPVYSALIDAVTVKKLLDHPFNLPVAAFDSAVATDKFGIPVPIGGGAVNSSIGIQLRFSVTPGDQAGITSQFTANPVPEPTSLLGLTIGGLALLHRRRK